jgi:hypothetical protein
MTEHVARYVLPAAYSLLPTAMRSEAATAMLLSIGLQESGFRHRRQLPRAPGEPPGPALGLWQFEPATIALVLRHTRVGSIANAALDRMAYTERPGIVTVESAIEHNDVLAAVFARLLLWTVPQPLPQLAQVDLSWSQYLWAWKPGRPRHQTWPDYYAMGWDEALRV